jgi:hypothetical protein
VSTFPQPNSSRPSARQRTRAIGVAGVLFVAGAVVLYLLSARRECFDVLVNVRRPFTIVDEATGQPICHATTSNILRKSANGDENCTYTIELTNANGPVSVTFHGEHYRAKTITLRDREGCIPAFDEFPSRVTLAREDD